MADYTAYERSDGACRNQVEAFCRHLTIDGLFDETTSPSIVDVNNWLTTSYALVASVLASAGYSITQTDTNVLAVLEELNAIDAVIKVELNAPTTIDGEPNDRFKWFQNRRDELIELISGPALGALGADSGGSEIGTIEATGLSKSEKQEMRDDTDAVQHRFQRDFGRNPRSGLNSTVNGETVI